MNPYFYITLYPADPRVEDADMSGLCVYHNKVLTSSRKRHNKDTIYLFIYFYFKEQEDSFIYFEANFLALRVLPVEKLCGKLL